ncbi:NAD(P)/FAD-dependent oxidoreductase [Oculatella sp. LEGE 06141]|uniref:phytoene desaturase family protein n=1 Tax=Oculatella sp. LEGE 06141 TaxID=1828648 RepID=UPI001880CD35|nr:NAD(P)/FAD-dependent oxidoreductase [Oculatella sp. LEGE 06141]MBE9180467.1 NAD(P)/FAD-dependent oxidoreductase [Oculatella sp. LEGE 06141]
MNQTVDVLVVGAGHNGLVAAILLARQGLRVLVVEADAAIGGAAKTERPFARAPELSVSTGAYLLGLMPPELLHTLEIDLPLIRRDPHYFLPTTDRRYLLFGSDRQAMQQQFTEFFSEADWHADQALQTELDHLRADIAPSWLESPLSIEDTAERYVRPELRSTFIALCRGSVGDYLNRFDFRSDLLKAMYAVTDGCTGLYGTWNTPGSGMNFLIHNMCRLPNSDGTWMMVRGGMGTVTQQLAIAAQKAGAEILTRCKVAQIQVHQATARGAVLTDGREIQATAVVVNADPFRMRSLLDADALPADYTDRLNRYQRDGSSFKVNLCLNGLPQFRCLPEAKGQHGSTIHLLPDEADVIEQLQAAFSAVEQGHLPDFPMIEWYIHTTLDPSLRDPAGHHSSALFVQWVPYEIHGSSWQAEEQAYVAHLLSICDRFAPGTSDLVEDVFALHPQTIEQHFGITRGHIHHVDNSFGFGDRLPYATPIAGLYSASSACHPAGSVIGAAGHNAAQCILKDLAASLH